jgi:hypothetical protein
MVGKWAVGQRKARTFKRCVGRVLRRVGRGQLLTDAKARARTSSKQKAALIALSFDSVRVVAMLLRTDFDHAATRAHLFARCSMFAKKVILTKRIRWFDDSNGSPSFNHCWMIWDRLHRGPPTLAYASGFAQNARVALSGTRPGRPRPSTPRVCLALTQPRPLVHSQLAAGKGAADRKNALASSPGTGRCRENGSNLAGCCYRHLQGTLSG